MIVAPDGQLLGIARHVKDVGPHTHAWERQGVGGDGAAYSRCTICGTRTTTAPLQVASRLDWILGLGEWDAEPVTVEPATPEQVEAAILEMQEAQRATSEEHRRAMPSVADVAPIQDPIKERLERAPEEQRKLDEQVHAAADRQREADERRARLERQAADAERPASEAEGDADETDGEEIADEAGQPARRRGRPRKNG